jgi:hypothetical protein
MELDAGSLAKVRYLDQNVAHGRAIQLLPFWDGVAWTVWRPTADGLQELHPRGAARTDYVAVEAASPNDIHMPFIEFIWQRVNIGDVLSFLDRIRDDVHHLGTNLAKVDHFFDSRSSLGLGVGAFVATELEYLFTLCRSLLDLIQELIAKAWMHVRLTDPQMEGKRRPLPKTLRKVLLDGSDQPKSSDQIREQFEVPPALAHAYAMVAPFFAKLRSFRDAVVHGGTSVDLVVCTERGFCVSKSRLPFRLFDIWKPEHAFNDQAYSLRPFISHLAVATIDACNALVEGLARQVIFAPELAPGYSVFIRGIHNEALIRAKRLCDGDEEPWWG